MKPNEENNHDLNTFFSEEYQRLKGFVRSKIKESADRDAEDIIQDVALKLMSRKQLSPINNIAGFVYGSIKNKIIDVLRAKKQKTTLADEMEQELIDQLNWLYNKADNAYSDQMIHELKMAIATLKPVYQEVVLAIDFERLSYKELSLATGVSQGTLMSRRHRALNILNETLKNKKND